MKLICKGLLFVSIPWVFAWSPPLGLMLILGFMLIIVRDGFIDGYYGNKGFTYSDSIDDDDDYKYSPLIETNNSPWDR